MKPHITSGVLIGVGLVLNFADAYYSGNLSNIGLPSASTSVLGTQILKVNRIISGTLTIGTIMIIVGIIMFLKHKRIFATR